MHTESRLLNGQLLRHRQTAVIAAKNVNMSLANPFRTVFRLPSRNQRVNWFPGHMTKGMRQIQQRLRNVDCIVEIHDARIPIAGRNSQFFDTITGKHIKLFSNYCNKLNTFHFLL